MKRHTKEEKIAILKQQGTGTMQQLADKTGVGLSTLTAWKAQLNGKAKRKVKVVKPDRMEILKRQLKDTVAKQKEIQREMTKLFFERMMEED